MVIHFIGAYGVSMRTLLQIEKSMGNVVTGSDERWCGHDARNVIGADLVVYTNAVKSDNVELVAARQNKIPTVERAELLGSIASTYKHAIAVSGCHGKTTTTSMLGEVFSVLNATVHVGSDTGSRIGGRDFFITEACEYNRSFLHLRPELGIVLNIELDHPDCYQSTDMVTSAFSEFGNRCKIIAVNGDDNLCRKAFNLDAERVSNNGKKIVTFGLNKSNDFYASCMKNEGGCRSFCVVSKGRHICKVELNVCGEHNVYNALAVITAASLYGLDLNRASNNLSKYGGVTRRFEKMGRLDDAEILCDYAHHPSEIRSTIKTAREIYDSVYVVFQPHTYSRTKALFCDFVDALCEADGIVLAPIYAARESSQEGVSSHALCRALIDRGKTAYCFDTFFDIDKFCKKLACKNCAVIFMGAGDIDNCCKQFLSSR